MTKCVAQWLTEQDKQSNARNIDVTRLAKVLAKEFFKDPQRGYSENIVVVLNKLRANKFEDPLKPAQESFNLTASSDNGAVARVTPLALAYYHSPERMIPIAHTVTQITHTHGEGVFGALLHCSILRLCLLQMPKDLKINTFLTALEQELALAEREATLDDDGLGLKSETDLFRRQLEAARVLCKKHDPTDEEVLDRLGHSNRALYSVPTALYCFLRASQEGKDPVRRALQLAISLGGDTDTIAAMTGAMVGACYGRESINDSLLRHCEEAHEFEQLADNIFELNGKI